MKARRVSRCTPCGNRIKPGDEIAAFLGKWTHTACKAADITRRAESAGPPLRLPQAPVDNELVKIVGLKAERHRGLAGLKDRNRP